MNLIVFALKEEDCIGNYPGWKKIYTGVGKINAAVSLLNAIKENKPSVVVNLGTAGGLTFEKDTFVCCSQFTQIDMNCQPLGLKKYQTPNEEQITIITSEYYSNKYRSFHVGSSDSFITTKEPYKYDGIDLVDMESYALAKICRDSNIEFRCFKYITDECDTQSPSDWRENILKAKIHFEKVMEDFI
jgi:adenosylhomocysteine nucleosidase